MHAPLAGQLIERHSPEYPLINHRARAITRQGHHNRFTVIKISKLNNLNREPMENEIFY